jgi:hypothetical protein
LSIYLLANKNTELLETIVFSGEGGDSVIIFTDPKKAETYIEDAGWGDKYTVATLTTIDFLEWLIKCHRNGISFMVPDPNRAEHESNLKIDTLNIEAHLNHAGEHITTVAQSDF